MNNRPDVGFDLPMHLGAADQDRTVIISLEGVPGHIVELMPEAKCQVADTVERR